MQITARLSFKHTVVVNVLKECGFTVKGFCSQFNLPLKTVHSFLNISCIPRKHKDAILRAFQELNPDINVEDLFPEEMKDLVPLLRPRESTKDIHRSMLTDPMDSNTLLIEDPNENEEERLVSHAPMDLIVHAVSKLSEKDQEALNYYFGLSGLSHTMEQMGKKYGITTPAVRERIRVALKHLGGHIRMNRHEYALAYGFKISKDRFSRFGISIEEL